MNESTDDTTAQNQALAWVNQRFPLSLFLKKHVTGYMAPRNFNIWYFFGSILLFIFGLQIITGIWLVMEYTPTADGSFASVQHIMREVRYGWLLRLLHTTGASSFFAIVYLHMYRSFIYGSYQKPRELVWLLGMVIYLMLLLEAFTGYVLPWGQMSFWGASVITSFASAIPYVGHLLIVWLRGDYNVSGVTLHRFFSLHVVAVPLLLCVFIYTHLVALHHVGSNNPEGIDLKPQDKIPFHPYYTVKDLFGVGVFLLVFCAVVFFAPTFGGLFLEPDNNLLANPLQTPDEISPVWYMTPFYAILRAVPDKLFGLICMGAAIALMFVLPWLDRSRVRSIRYKGSLSKIAMLVFVVSFVGLGVLGHESVSPLKTGLARCFALGYFAFFLLMPFYSRYEKTKPLPTEVHS